MSALSGKHAAVIGIDAYGNGLTPLRTAVADARAVAGVLESSHGYPPPIMLVEQAATAEGIRRLLEERLPAEVLPDSALVLYFAGHGVAHDGDDGPEGFLIPQDGGSSTESWLSMRSLHQALAGLPCRHLLVVLDCCFAGSFRWTSTRKTLLPTLDPLYDSQYERFLEGTAWQVLTSASHEEEAQDVGHNCRDCGDAHSPFAAALLAGLAGDSDSSRGRHDADGVITATELHQFIFEELAPCGQARRQTPGLWPLKPDNTGEFIFLSPRREKRTVPDPPLDETGNPWLGLEAYADDDTPLFFGRDRVVEALEDELVDGDSPLIRVVGASGTGKSSVVKAGLLPRLRQPPPEKAERLGEWSVVSCGRLGRRPAAQLASAFRRIEGARADRRRLLVIDQFEEVFTQCHDPAERDRFLDLLSALVTAAGRRLRILVTLRSDFEPQLEQTVLAAWLGEAAATGDPGAAVRKGRYVVPGFETLELRAVIEGPARVRALFFEPPELVDRLVDEVVAMPGGLPLLSFALSEMYRRSVLRRRQTGALDRSLNEDDYRTTGGVVGSLHRRADELLQDAEDNGRLDTVRRLALRMVSTEGGRLARRRIPEDELVYADPDEQERVRAVTDRVSESRFVVRDDGYLEAAHDTLVDAWPQLRAWIAEAVETELPLLRAVNQAARAWQEGDRAPGLLWTDDPRLAQLRPFLGELNQLEEEFVDASKARKRRRRLVASGVVASYLGLLAAALWRR